MAVRTVAAGGGVFSAGATWVGGVAPVANDSIIANGSSGNLTLGTNTPNLLGADFTGYTGTLACALYSLNSGGSIILGSGMTITQTSTNGRINMNQIAATLTSNGVRIPSLNWSNNVSLNDDVLVGSLPLNPTNLVSGPGNLIFYGTTININALYFNTNSKIILRPDGDLTIQSGTSGYRGTLQIDTANTINMGSYLRIDNADGNKLEITKPLTFFSPTTQPKLIFSRVNSCSIDAGTFSINFLEMIFNANHSGSSQTTLNILSGSVSVNTFLISPSANNVNANTNVAIQGDYPISMKSLYCQSYANFDASNNDIRQFSSRLQLKGGFTYSVANEIYIGGPGVQRSYVTGVTPSTPTIYFTGLTYSITNAILSNLDFVSPTVTFNYLENTSVSLSSTTGISLLTPGGGGSGGSFTFVN